MNIKKPKFWDYKKPNIVSFFLLPFTIPIIINNFLNILKKKDSKIFKIKTICVGNIYVGGTGKTPCSIKIQEILDKLSIKSVFIKKFYDNTLDEDRLLKKRGKVIVADSRRIDALELANTSYEVAIFDDGLQDNSINYDLKLVCFNKKKFIGNGLLIPAGPLREKINSLKKYDGIFLNGNNEDCAEIILEIKKQNKDIKIFETTYSLSNLSTFDKEIKYVAFAGIGIPSNFYNTLIEHNFNIVKFIDYPDHYKYTYKDIVKIKKIAKNLNAEIITTEKDYSRIELNNDNSLQNNIRFVKMELIIKNEKSLIDLIKKNI